MNEAKRTNCEARNNGGDIFLNRSGYQVIFFIKNSSAVFSVMHYKP